jgi:hypothetical protein
VYYVPKLERNIISLGQLTERGCKIVLEENYLWGYDRQRKLIMKVERSKNILYYLDLDRVDLICDGFLVEKQWSAPFPCESRHVTQDIICEGENLGQTEESPASTRSTWPEGGSLKEKRYARRSSGKNHKETVDTLYRFRATQSSCSKPSKQAKQRVHSEARLTCCEARRKWAARRGSIRRSRKKRTQ